MCYIRQKYQSSESSGRRHSVYEGSVVETKAPFNFLLWVRILVSVPGWKTEEVRALAGDLRKEGLQVTFFWIISVSSISCNK